MKDRGLTKEALQKDKTIEVPPLKIKAGLCKSKVLSLEEIQKSIDKAQKEMMDFEQNLAPGTKDDLYIGTAFIVLKT